MKHNYIIAIITTSFLLLTIDSFCQKIIDKVYINDSQDSCCLGFKNNLYRNSDTLNYYVIIEEKFYNDTVSVYNGDTKIFEESIFEIGDYGIAKIVKVGDVKSVTKIGIRVNSNNPVFYFNARRDIFYYRLGLSAYGDELEICYSKYKPTYR